MDLVDNYEHPETNVIYILESIPTSETEEQFNEQILQGCSCGPICTAQKGCACIINSGATYIKNDVTETQDDLYKLHIINPKIPFYECNINCNCYNSICGQRLVQFGPRRNMQIQYTGGKGWGLFTSTDVRMGSFICEYAGEIISANEAKQRYKKTKDNNLMNYIFCINESFGNKNIRTFIDPLIFGNIGRYINHSCDPNCNLVPIRINNTIPKLCIFSKQDIEANQELTFDYGDGSLGFDISKTSNKINCLCTAKSCRGYLPFCEEL